MIILMILFLQIAQEIPSALITGTALIPGHKFLHLTEGVIVKELP